MNGGWLRAQSATPFGRYLERRSLTFLAIAVLSSCGGGGGPSAPAVSVTVTPASATTPMNGAPLTFHADVMGSAEQQVIWTVTNGSQTLPGLVSSAGVLQSITDCHLLGATLTIVATSVASRSAIGTATVSVFIGAVNPDTITVPPD